MCICRCVFGCAHVCLQDSQRIPGKYKLLPSLFPREFGRLATSRSLENGCQYFCSKSTANQSVDEIIETLKVQCVVFEEDIQSEEKALKLSLFSWLNKLSRQANLKGRNCILYYFVYIWRTPTPVAIISLRTACLISHY